MTGESTQPIIFLAFANDREDRVDNRYLRNLPEEARRLQSALAHAQDEGLCRLVIRQNATVDDILDVFQHADYRNRITLFHYGGHANSYQLLFETAEGSPAVADAAGLAAFLGQQTGLEIVFLNGCSTQHQAQGLLDAGVSAVVATSQAIDDAVATEFATRFYRGLAGGAALSIAFREAEGAVQTTRGASREGSTRNLYPADVQESLLTDRLPWALYLREGAEATADWNLPDAAGNPLFGLPPLPELDLPQRPSRHLNWYRREDAPVFFGRGREIRDLYERVTAARTAPLVLFYGQAGVGKSSLLAAGLLPRLERDHAIRYARRDQARGLLGTLAAALGADEPGDLAAAWRAIEEEEGHPLVVVLDQGEEVYTRPNAAQPDELATFLAGLQALWADTEVRPRGKLLLGFRKEWLAEIEKQVAEHKLPRSRVFLQRLDRRGVVEVVTGVARDEGLRQQYGLVVEEALPGLVADDLLADRDSPVAPTLAVLLSKMWDAARQRDYDQPRFDGALYAELRRQGLGLDDFLAQQLESLGAQQPEAVASGLTLDLLAHHTTPLGTAEQRAMADLEETYRHQAGALPALVQGFQDLYLLVDPVENRPGLPRASRLAHDTLAPLVRKSFDESDLPGQRARRILENRALDCTDEQTCPPLDDVDLDAVEEGQAGMRAWTPAEEQLVTASRVARRRRQRSLRIWIGVGVLAAVLILVAAAVAVWQRQQAVAESEKAERQASVSLSRLLVNEAQNASDPELKILLGLEAIRAATDKGYPPNAESVMELQHAVQEGPIKAWRFAGDYSSPYQDVEFSPDSTLLALRRRLSSGTARLLDVASYQPLTLPTEIGNVDYYSFDPSGRYVAAVGVRKIHLLDAKTRQAVCPPFQFGYSEIAVLFDPTGSLLFAAPGDDAGTRRSPPGPGQLLDIASCETLASVPIEGNLLDAQFVQDGTRLIILHEVSEAEVHDPAQVTGTLTTYQGWSTIWDVSSPRHPAQIDTGKSQLGQNVLSRDGSRLARSSEGTIQVLDTATTLTIFTHTLDTDGTMYAFLSSQGRYLATTMRGKRAPVQIWDLETGSEMSSFSPQSDSLVADVVFMRTDTGPAVLRLGNPPKSGFELHDMASGNLLASQFFWNASVTMLERSPNEKEILFALDDGTVHLWNAEETQEEASYPESVRGTGSMAFSPDGRLVAMATSEGTVRLWPNRITEIRANAKDALFAVNDSLLVFAQSKTSNGLIANLQGQVLLDDLYDDCSEPVAFSADGRWLAIQSFDDGTGFCDAAGTRIWDLASVPAKEHAWLPGAACDLGCFVNIISPDGNWIAFNDVAVAGYYDEHDGLLEEASAFRTVTLWNIPRAERLPFLEHEFGVSALAFSPVDDLLATLDDMGTVRLWSFGSGTDPSPTELPQNPDGVGTEEDHLVFSPNGKRLALVSALFSSLQVWNVQTGELVTDMPGVIDIRFSRDGKALVVALGNDKVQLWDAETLEPRPHSFIGHRDTIRAFDLGTDGSQNLLVTGSDDQTARVWDLDTGEEVTRLPHQASVVDVAFTAAGKQVVTVTEDGSIHVWPVDTETLIQMACDILSRHLSDREWEDYIGELKEPRPTCEGILP